MKRPLDPASASPSSRRSPSESPERKRPSTSAGAGPSARPREEHLPSSRSPSPTAAARSREDLAPRASLFPAPPHAETLIDLPRDTFEQIATRLTPKQCVMLAAAGKGPRALLAPELQMWEVARAATSVDTLEAFQAALGTNRDALDPRARTVRASLGLHRRTALLALVRSIPSLPAPDRARAIEESVRAALESARPFQRPLVLPLINAARGIRNPRNPPNPALGIPPAQLDGPWRALFTLAKYQPGDELFAAEERKLPLLNLFICARQLPPAQRQEAVRAGFEELGKLPPESRAQPLAAMMQAAVQAPSVLHLPILRAGVDALAPLPTANRAELLTHLPLLIRSLPPAEDPLLGADSQRREGMRALRQAVAGLPAQQQAAPLAALAQAIRDLPAHERHLEMQAALPAIERLPGDAAPRTLANLFNKISDLAPPWRSSALHDGIDSTLRLQPQQRGEPLIALARAIPDLRPAERAGDTGRWLAAVATQPERQLLDNPLSVLTEVAGRLANDGQFPEGFDVIRAWSLELPVAVRGDALTTLVKGLPAWPQDGQAARFAAIQASMNGLPVADQASVLNSLAMHLGSTLDADRPEAARRLEAAITRLPPEHQREPLQSLDLNRG